MFDCELLNHVLDGKEITKTDAYEIFEIAKNEPSELYSTSTRLRNTHKQKTVTFSKKAFFNLVNLCRDVCSYCTYKSEPNQQKTSMMSKKNVTDLAKLAKNQV